MERRIIESEGSQVLGTKEQIRYVSKCWENMSSNFCRTIKSDFESLKLLEKYNFESIKQLSWILKCEITFVKNLFISRNC